MKLGNLITIAQMEAFMDGSQAVGFAVTTNKDERYLFVESLLNPFAYIRLKRREKGIMIQCLQKVTGYSRQQVTRMIQRFTYHVR